MSYAVPGANPALEPAQRLRVRCEAMRVTARLSHVMAWLLEQKAVELRLRAAAESYRLSEEDIGLLESNEELPELPSGLKDLLQRSRALYVRVTRLDQLVQRSATG